MYDLRRSFSDFSAEVKGKQGGEWCKCCIAKAAGSGNCNAVNLPNVSFFKGFYVMTQYAGSVSLSYLFFGQIFDESLNPPSFGMRIFTDVKNVHIVEDDYARRVSESRSGSECIIMKKMGCEWACEKNFA